MKFKKAILFIITISIICLVLIPHITRANSNKPSDTFVNYTTVTVCYGDTLWAIAADYLPNNTDIRKLIYDIKKTNKLQSSVITPGQQLIIPCD